MFMDIYLGEVHRKLRLFLYLLEEEEEEECVLDPAPIFPWGKGEGSSQALWEAKEAKKG